MLCPSRDRPPHGHATTGVGSFGSSAGLFSLPAIHELPLDDSSSDADSKVDAHPPYPIQIGVCLQSRQTPDLGTPASQLTTVGHTQDRAATGPAAVVLPYFLDAENGFLNKKEDPSHSSSANCSEPSASIHNTNATADLSSYNGTPATLGQHTTAQIAKILNGRGLSQPPPFLRRMTCAPLSSHLNTLTPPMIHRLHTSATMSSFSGIRLRFSHNGRYYHSLWILSKIIVLGSL